MHQDMVKALSEAVARIDSTEILMISRLDQDGVAHFASFSPCSECLEALAHAGFKEVQGIDEQDIEPDENGVRVLSTSGGIAYDA